MQTKSLRIWITGNIFLQHFIAYTLLPDGAFTGQETCSTRGPSQVILHVAEMLTPHRALNPHSALGASFAALLHALTLIPPHPLPHFTLSRPSAA